jgi:hypothetical protein
VSPGSKTSAPGGRAGQLGADPHSVVARDQVCVATISSGKPLGSYCAGGDCFCVRHIGLHDSVRAQHGRLSRAHTDVFARVEGECPLARERAMAGRRRERQCDVGACGQSALGSTERTRPTNSWKRLWTQPIGMGIIASRR